MVSYWVLRQNYAEITNQSQIMSLILTKKIVTCPWGGWGLAKENVIRGYYNETTSDKSGRTSSGQDRKFVEDIMVGDIILIPFTGIKGCIVARITSLPQEINTGLYWKENDGHINISKHEGTPFMPIGRYLEIIDTGFIPVKRTGQLTLSKMNKDIIDQIRVRYHL